MRITGKGLALIVPVTIIATFLAAANALAVDLCNEFGIGMDSYAITEPSTTIIGQTLRLIGRLLPVLLATSVITFVFGELFAKGSDGKKRLVLSVGNAVYVYLLVGLGLVIKFRPDYESIISATEAFAEPWTWVILGSLTLGVIMQIMMLFRIIKRSRKTAVLPKF